MTYVQVKQSHNMFPSENLKGRSGYTSQKGRSLLGMYGIQRTGTPASVTHTYLLVPSTPCVHARARHVVNKGRNLPVAKVEPPLTYFA